MGELRLNAQFFFIFFIFQRVVHEGYAAMDTLVLQSVEALGPPPVTVTRAKSATIALAKSSTPILLAFILAFLIEYF